MKRALIIQGGGFRTAFSAGVLDAFLKNKHNPFDFYVAVSGGTIAVSYFIANQSNHCFNSICFLAGSSRFVNYTRVLRLQPIMDVEVFHDITRVHFPFDIDAANTHLTDKKFAIVITNKITGEPYYCDPTQTNWQEAVIASCSLPFITKGNYQLDGNDYMDGAWSDPLPVEWVASQGAREITIVRTSPANEKISKTILDRFGEIYYRKNEKLKSAFARNHEKYNRSIDFINDPPKEIVIKQVAPLRPLKAGLFTNSVSIIEEDYRNGLKCGDEFCRNL